MVRLAGRFSGECDCVLSCVPSSGRVLWPSTNNVRFFATHPNKMSKLCLRAKANQQRYILHSPQTAHIKQDGSRPTTFPSPTTQGPGDTAGSSISRWKCESLQAARRPIVAGMGEGRVDMAGRSERVGSMVYAILGGKTV
jgi:hypothetical protein